MRARIVLAVLLVVGACGPAEAHSPIKGIGTFYNGLLHPILVPAHLLALIAVGLLIGQHTPRASRLALPAFTTAVTLVLCLDLWTRPQPQWVLLAIALAAGLAIAVARTGPLVATLLVVAAGVAVAIDSAPDAVPADQVWLGLLGTGLGALLIVTYCGGLAAWFDRPWQQIAIRAAGSWIAASAMLALTLEFLPSARAPV